MSDKQADKDTDKVTPAPRSSGMQLLALAVAVLAVAVSVWGAWQIQALRTLPEQMIGRQGQLDELNRQLTIVAAELDKQRTIADDLQASMEQSLTELADLPLRLDQIEQAFANMPGIDQQGKASWLKTEALYYMRVANAQALLAGDQRVAARALELADRKLAESQDPTVAPVRAKLAEEIALLNAIPEVDRAGISFRLQTLAKQVDSWPLREIAPDNFNPDMATPDAELTGWARFVATLKSVFSSIVSVTETESSPTRRFSEIELALVEESIRAELQVARISFASGNNELFRQSLQRALDEIENYFDLDTTAVAAAVSTLQEIQATELPEAMPDISGSMALLLASAEEAR